MKREEAGGLFNVSEKPGTEPDKSFFLTPSLGSPSVNLTL